MLTFIYVFKSNIISCDYLSQFLLTDWTNALFLNHRHAIVTNASVATWNTDGVDLVVHADNAIFRWLRFIHLAHFNTVSLLMRDYFFLFFKFIFWNWILLRGRNNWSSWDHFIQNWHEFDQNKYNEWRIRQQKVEECSQIEIDQVVKAQILNIIIKTVKRNLVVSAKTTVHVSYKLIVDLAQRGYYNFSVLSHDAKASDMEYQNQYENTYRKRVEAALILYTNPKATAT